MVKISLIAITVIPVLTKLSVSQTTSVAFHKALDVVLDQVSNFSDSYRGYDTHINM